MLGRQPTFLLLAVPLLAGCARSMPASASTAPTAPPASAQPVSAAAGIGGPSITVDPGARPAPTSILVASADAVCEGVQATPATVAREEAGCAARDRSACYELSKHAWCGAGTRRDRQRAAELNGGACDGGYFDACPNAAMSAMVAGDVTHAVAFVEKGCRGSDTGSCNTLATMFLQGDGVPRDAKRANEIYGALCDKGDAVACANAATLLVAGIGVDRDLSRARDVAKRACDGHGANGCDLFGFLLAFVQPADVPRSITVLEGLCSAGDAEGCDDLGAVLSGPGSAAKEARARAVAAFKQGCDRKRPEACEHFQAMEKP